MCIILCNLNLDQHDSKINDNFLLDVVLRLFEPPLAEITAGHWIVSKLLVFWNSLYRYCFVLNENKSETLSLFAEPASPIFEVIRNIVAFIAFGRTTKISPLK